MGLRGRRTSKSTWFAVAKVAVSIALLIILSRSLDLGALVETLTRLPITAFAAALALFAIQTCLLAVRWWLVMTALSAPIGYGRLVRLTFVGVFFNQVLPTSVGGDAVRMWHVHRCGAAIDTAIKGVVFDRVSAVLGLSLLVAFGVWTLGAQLDSPTLRFALLAVPPLGVLGIVCLAWLDHMPSAWQQWRPLGELARLGADARRVLLAPRFAVQLLVLSIASHALSALVVYAFAVGLALELSVWDCLAVVPAAILISMIPVSFAGWGLREGAMVAMFAVLGVSADTALAMSLAFGIALLAASLPGCVLWRAGRTPSATAATP